MFSHSYSRLYLSNSFKLSPKEDSSFVASKKVLLSGIECLILIKWLSCSDIYKLEVWRASDFVKPQQRPWHILRLSNYTCVDAGIEWLDQTNSIIYCTQSPEKFCVCQIIFYVAGRDNSLLLRNHRKQLHHMNLEHSSHRLFSIFRTKVATVEYIWLRVFGETSVKEYLYNIKTNKSEKACSRHNDGKSYAARKNNNAIRIPYDEDDDCILYCDTNGKFYSMTCAMETAKNKNSDPKLSRCIIKNKEKCRRVQTFCYGGKRYVAISFGDNSQYIYTDLYDATEGWGKVRFLRKLIFKFKINYRLLSKIRKSPQDVAPYIPDYRLLEIAGITYVSCFTNFSLALPAKELANLGFLQSIELPTANPFCCTTTLCTFGDIRISVQRHPDISELGKEILIIQKIFATNKEASTSRDKAKSVKIWRLICKNGYRKRFNEELNNLQKAGKQLSDDILDVRIRDITNKIKNIKNMVDTSYSEIKKSLKNFADRLSFMIREYDSIYYQTLAYISPAVKEKLQKKPLLALIKVERAFRYITNLLLDGEIKNYFGENLSTDLFNINKTLMELRRGAVLSFRDFFVIVSLYVMLAMIFILSSIIIDNLGDQCWKLFGK